MEPLTSVPATITAGDSVALLLSYSDYPASEGWALSWAIAGPQVVSVASVADGDAHALDLSATQTLALTAGTYTWRLRAADGAGTVQTFSRGTIVVESDLARMAPGERTSWLERIVEVLRCSLLGSLDHSMATYMIGARQVMEIPAKDRMAMLAKYEAALAMERAGGTAFGVPIIMTATGFTS